MVHRISSPSYIFRRSNGNYYFRHAIPITKRVPSFSGKNEIRKSLNTNNRQEALLKAKKIWIWIITNMNNITSDKEILKFIDDFLNSESGYFKHKEHYNNASTMRGWSEYYYEQILTIVRAGLFEYLKPDFSNIDDILTKSEDIEEYHEKNILDKAYNDQLNKLSEPKDKKDPELNNDICLNQEHLLSNAINEYLKHYKLSVSELTYNECKNILLVFLDCIGDIDIKQIKQKDLADYRDELRQYPSNKNKKTELIGLNFKEVITVTKTHNLDVLKPNSIKKYVSRVSGLFTWFYEMDYTEKHIGQNLTKKIKGNTNFREAYSKEQINLLFNANNYRSSISYHLSRFWIPLIALYTGARIEEIATLRTADIKEVEGIYCIDINISDEKKVKTENSIRTIPINNELLQVGLIEYRNEVKKIKKNIYLFPDIVKNNNSNKLSSKIGKWRSRYLTKLNIKIPSIVFHSFRNTMSESLRQLETPDADLKGIIGHAQTGKPLVS